MAWIQLTTKIYQTNSGVWIRADTELCGKLKVDGTRCDGIATRFYIKYKDPMGAIQKNYAFICNHQQDDLNDRIDLRIWWNTEMLEHLFDKIHLGKKFRDIHDELKKEFPMIDWKSYSKPETRPSKGKFKEFDCSAKKKYEDIKLNSCGDVWDNKTLRKDAKASCISNKDHTGFRNTLIESSKKLIDYSTCKLCKHEMYWHKNGHCDECKGYCPGEKQNEIKTTI